MPADTDSETASETVLPDAGSNAGETPEADTEAGSSPAKSSKASTSVPVGIYHEKQVGALCALHCVNNLLQGPYFDERGFREVAQELDAAERLLTGGELLDYGNAREDGYFNVQVVETVLRRAGFEMRPLRGQGGWDLQAESAFILNRRKHWFAVRRIGQRWFDLNSCLHAPRYYPDASLRSHMTGAVEAGYSIFMVRGRFPALSQELCDELAAGAGKRRGGADGGPGLGEQDMFGLAFFAAWFGAAQFDPHIGPVYTWRANFKRRKVSRAYWWSKDDAAAGPPLERPQEPPPELLGSPAPGEAPVSPTGGDAYMDEMRSRMSPSDLTEVELANQHKPLFVTGTAVLAVVLWAACSVRGQCGGAWSGPGGLESVLPGRTGLILHEDCRDLRPELWRWFSYQFTHATMSQATMNALLCLAAGAALEGFYGAPATALLFNAGVFGGACCHAVLNAHAQLLGCSAGCYALLGMRLAHLAMNWPWSRFRVSKLLCLLLLLALDTLNVRLTQLPGSHSGSVPMQHAAHIGGLTTGLLLGLGVGSAPVSEHCQRARRILALLVGAGLAGFCVYWVTFWPPRTLAHPTPWCWARQVFNASLFPDQQYHCVRCASAGCEARWSRQRYATKVNFHVCNELHGWSLTEP